jgi:plasmid stabilization system protein ParE
MLSAEAAAQVREIDAWWKENRLGAADLFVSELQQALSDLASTPSLGTKYEARPAVRRLLRRTHFHLYFVRRDERIDVIAVWSAYRGKGPAL